MGAYQKAITLWIRFIWWEKEKRQWIFWKRFKN